MCECFVPRHLFCRPRSHFASTFNHFASLPPVAPSVLTLWMSDTAADSRSRLTQRSVSSRGIWSTELAAATGISHRMFPRCIRSLKCRVQSRGLKKFRFGDDDRTNQLCFQSNNNETEKTRILSLTQDRSILTHGKTSQSVQTDVVCNPTLPAGTAHPGKM